MGTDAARDEREFRRMIWWMRALIATVLVGFAVGGFAILSLVDRTATAQRAAAVSARVVIEQSCGRLNATRSALRTIIARGDRNLLQFYQEGTINRAQYLRSLRASRDARRDLGDADCAALARRIPVKP